MSLRSILDALATLAARYLGWHHERYGHDGWEPDHDPDVRSILEPEYAAGYDAGYDAAMREEPYL